MKRLAQSQREGMQIDLLFFGAIRCNLRQGTSVIEAAEEHKNFVEQLIRKSIANYCLFSAYKRTD